MKHIFIFLLVALATTSCTKMDGNNPVEVRVVSIWTDSDFSAARKNADWSTPTFYPHIIVETTKTRQRYRVFGNPIGSTGEVFCVACKNLR